MNDIIEKVSKVIDFLIQISYNKIKFNPKRSFVKMKMKSF